MKTAKKVLTMSLLAAFLLSFSGTTYAEGAKSGTDATAPQGAAIVKGKDEVIYARIAGNGTAESAYAVNHFELAQGGSFTDYGDYTSVVNLTDTQPLTLSGDTVTAQTAAENYYYQGYLSSADLPWTYAIEYTLNGSRIQPQDLAGKSGRLEIRMTSAKNGKFDPVFYDNYMMQISVTLDTEKCSDISADRAAIAIAGKSRVLAFTVMPKHNADITVTADVRDFEMNGIDITAMPFSMSVDIPDTSGMLNDFTQLSDAISELNDGVGKLKNGVADMKTGSMKLKSGSADFKNGISQLNANSSQLTSASSQIMTALSQIAESLNGSGSAKSQPDISDLAKLPEGLNKLANGLDQVVGGMKQLNESYTQAYSALDNAVSGIPNNDITEEQIKTLYAKTDVSQQALLGKLVESYTAAKTVKGTYDQVKPAFAAVSSALDTLSQSVNTISGTLNGMSKQIEGALSGSDMMAQLKQLSDGMSELSANYADFHGGLIAFTTGVNKLAGGYSALNSGVASLGDGISNLYDGVDELYAGTGRMADETADMPETLRSEIDSMTSQYTGGKFKPVSFVSGKNTKTGFVQFVFKSAEIKVPEITDDTAAEAGRETFWDRLMKLF